MGEKRKFKVLTGIAIGAVVIIVTAISIAVLHPKDPELIPMVLQQTRVQDPSGAELPRQEVSLFFLDVESLKLVREKRALHLSTELPDRLKQIISALISGSDHGLKSTIPSGAILHEVYIDAESIAYLDFSRHLTDAHIGGTTAEITTINTILQTVLANFSDEIQHVQILIEGQQVVTIAGHIDISHPLALAPPRQLPSKDMTADSR